MNERLIENWLDKANERTFQIPFCHSLASEGFTIVHLSRHCAMEMGKDIIAIAPDGVPCAYQVKGVAGGKLGLGEYRRDLEKQLVSLALTAIEHPAVKTKGPHRAYVVLNGELEEEVSSAIQGFNRMHPKHRIQTVLRGELLRRFRDLQKNFWPAEVREAKLLLEMYFLSGRETLPKLKLAALFESMLPFHKVDGRKPSRDSCGRAIAACAVFCSLAISAFSNADNHAAEFEAWTLLFAYILGFAEKWRLPRACYQTELDIASRSMFNALGRLHDELERRTHLVEGHPLVDSHVFRVRVTYLLGSLGVYGLWNRIEGADKEGSDFLRRFFKEHRGRLWVWGEYAIPQILSWYFYASKVDASMETDQVLYKIGREMALRCQPDAPAFLASPYYDAETLLPHIIGVSDEPLDDKFDGHSFALESIMHLLVRTNLKQHVRVLWHDFTKVWTSTFEPAHAWDFYRWHCSDGINRDVEQKRKREWQDLRREAMESRGRGIPKLFREYPVHLLAFLCVCPHRLSSSVVRWLATRLG